MKADADIGLSAGACILAYDKPGYCPLAAF